MFSSLDHRHMIDFELELRVRFPNQALLMRFFFVQSIKRCVQCFGQEPVLIRCWPGARLVPCARCPVPVARCPVSVALCPVPGARCPLPDAQCVVCYEMMS